MERTIIALTVVCVGVTLGLMNAMAVTGNGGMPLIMLP